MGGQRPTLSIEFTEIQRDRWRAQLEQIIAWFDGYKAGGKSVPTGVFALALLHTSIRNAKERGQ